MKIESILKKNISLFNNFKEVYLFGSALYKESPNDIDLLLIFDDSKGIKIDRLILIKELEKIFQ